jgi:hypothetical protein
MEAIKNLIPEGFLGNAGTSSPERIAQGILISHYQVKSPKTFLCLSRIHVNCYEFSFLNFAAFGENDGPLAKVRKPLRSAAESNPRSAGLTLGVRDGSSNLESSPSISG